MSAERRLSRRRASASTPAPAMRSSTRMLRRFCSMVARFCPVRKRTRRPIRLDASGSDAATVTRSPVSEFSSSSRQLDPLTVLTALIAISW